jgi:2,5-diketo-D-gluconate reductase A
VTPRRIGENIEIFDFELSEAEMAAFAALDSGRRFGPDPATFASP